MAEFRLETTRVVLREWRDTDFDALHALCTDPAVMATIGPLHDEERTRGLLSRMQERQRQHGCTFWAMERREDSRVIGFCGVSRSRGLMERLGMRYREDMDFEHPAVADDSPLKPHVTYWLEQAR